jgi:hypothetical protein
MSVFHHHQQIDGHEERGFSAPVDTRARADLRQENAVCCSQVLAPMFVLSLSWQKHRFKYKTTSRKTTSRKTTSRKKGVCFRTGWTTAKKELTSSCPTVPLHCAGTVP